MDIWLLSALGALGTFALVGLIWSITEAYFEEQRKDQR